MVTGPSRSLILAAGHLASMADARALPYAYIGPKWYATCSLMHEAWPRMGRIGDRMMSREAAIESALRDRVAAHMAASHPDVAYELDVFESNAGGHNLDVHDEWDSPLAANLTVPSLNVEDAYGLCNATTGTVAGQADFMFQQILSEGKGAI